MENGQSISILYNYTGWSTINFVNICDLSYKLKSVKLIEYLEEKLFKVYEQCVVYRSLESIDIQGNCIMIDGSLYSSIFQEKKNFYW